MTHSNTPEETPANGDLIPIGKPGKMLQLLFEEHGILIDIGLQRGRYTPGTRPKDGYSFNADTDPIKRVTARERMMVGEAVATALAITENWNTQQKGGIIHEKSESNGESDEKPSEAAVLKIKKEVLHLHSPNTTPEYS